VNYTAVTDADRRAMLDAIGAGSVEELFAAIPERVRLRRPLDLPPGQTQEAVEQELRALAARNTSADDEVSFLGAGMYDHYVPAVVDMLTTRSEFLTPYTPYQPEVSQGTLQVMFEYQTAMSELTGLPVSNASVYEGPSAVGAAAYLAKLANGRPRLVVSGGLHPHSREVLETMSGAYGKTVVDVPLRDGVTDPEALAAALDTDVSAVFVQQPNVLGAVEDLAALSAAAKEHGVVVVCAADPIALGVLEAPGACGVDLCVGEGQPLGNRLDFGGPSFGFFCAAEPFLRRMPGRIAGETTDVDGRRGFVLTLQTREQHIRREKATHNICTSQALNALAGVVYLSWLGRQGLVELGELLLQRTHYAREALAALDGVEKLHDQPVVREFALRLDAPVERVVARCQEQGINPGLALGRLDPEHADVLLVALTERRSRADIDRLVEVLGAAVAAERAQGARGEPSLADRRGRVEVPA
jgi:glycine dehydrogenase subunit 1